MDQIIDGRTPNDPFTAIHPRGTKRNQNAGEQ